jgi:hypothetical protein
MGNEISFFIIIVLASNEYPISAAYINPYAIHYFSHLADRIGILTFKRVFPLLYRSDIVVNLPERFLRRIIIAYSNE